MSYRLVQLPELAGGGPFDPRLPFEALHDGAAVASGELLAGSPAGAETGRLLNVRWAGDHVEAAAVIVAAALKAAAAAGPVQIDASTNAAVHPDSAARNALWESFGFDLWQEKEGFLWTDTGQDLPAPTRIGLRKLSETGPEPFLAAIEASATGTLDRVDADAAAELGLPRWAKEFLAATADAEWLLAETPAGTPVGFVAVGEFDPGVGTIMYIGVLPDHRGRGYVDELMKAANRSAREQGFGSMLSDSDVLNAPMHAAMERNGHHAADTAWHKWIWRKRV